MLEESLVSVDQQPYEIPNNWLWVYNKAIANMIRGLSYKKHEVVNKSENTLLVLRGGNIQEDKLVNQDDNVYVDHSIVPKEKLLMENDVVLVSSTGSSKVIGKAAIVEQEFIGQTFGAFMTTVRPNKFVYKKYLSLYFQSSQYRKTISNLANGSNINNIKSEHLEYIKIPLPPLKEQIQIVEKIEKLFYKLDAAKQLIEEVKEKFEHRRMTILSKAFEMFEPTCYKKIEEVCTIKNGYAFKSKDFVNEGIQLIRMGNLYQNRLDLTRNPVFLPVDFNKKLLDKYKIQNGDILLTLTGTKYKRDYGYAVKIENLDRELLLNQRIMSLTPHTDDDYLFYFLQTSEFRNDFFSFETGGVNQGNVGSKSVATIKIPWIDDTCKRKKIVNFIKKQLEVEYFVYELLNNININVLKKSILSKAFKGELGTNEPTDEPAIELLKSILQEKE